MHIGDSINASIKNFPAVQPTYLDVINYTDHLGEWTVKIDGVRIGDITSNKKLATVNLTGLDAIALLDTGNSYLQIPSSLFETLLKLVLGG